MSNSESTPTTVAYTGSVSVDGPAHLRTLPDAQIRKVAVSEMSNNCYLLTCTTTGDQLLIDAADNASRLLNLIEQSTGKLNSILTTHQHWDHHRALADVQASTGAQTYAGEADADALPVDAHHRLHHGDVLRCGELTLEVIGLRGHTPGSVALLLRSMDGSTHLFTGDSLFPGGPGKTHSSEDFTTLMNDLESRVFDVLPDDTWVYPGHGNDTMLGAERGQLPQWRARGW